MRLDFPFGPSRPARQDDEGGPRRILLLADLHPAAPPDDILVRPIVRVDLDNIDDLLARCAPSVLIGPGEGGERLRFRSFDDFHPDVLLKNPRLFGRLLDLRNRLQDPGTFANALAELDAEVGARTPDTAGGSDAADGPHRGSIDPRTASGPKGREPALDRRRQRTPSAPLTI